MQRIGIVFGMLVVTVAIGACASTRPQATPEKAAEARRLVEDSAAVIASMRSDPAYSELDRLLEHAAGVLIFPRIVKYSLGYGGKAGQGVLLGKDDEGRWSPPAFYRLEAPSAGGQIGRREESLVLVLMSDWMLKSAVDELLRLEPDLVVAAGPHAASLGLDEILEEDKVYAFSRGEGAFIGFAVESGSIEARFDLNYSYYDGEPTPRAIVYRREVTAPGAEPLKEALAASAERPPGLKAGSSRL
jgi:lipid-binding SYLF domain-containing protein